MITVDFKRLSPVPGDKILDMGCGEGRHTARASEYPGIFCVGGDRCHGDLVTGREKLIFHHQLSPDAGGLWALTRSDIGRMPFPDNAFDKVICSEVLEHIPAEATAITELIRVLKPGGTLVVTVPRWWPEKICWMLSREYGYGNSPGGHIRIYEKKKLIRKIIRHGMIFRGSHHAHALHTPYWWLKCLLGLHRDQAPPVRLYHRLLVWDLMEQPALTRLLDRFCNPVIGKSVALYFKKANG